MAEGVSDAYVNWVDPDVLAYYEETGDRPQFNQPAEEAFLSFFAEEWSLPEFDDIRARWDPLITDEDPRGRLYGKNALWSLARLRRTKHGHVSQEATDE